jgi:DNA-binding CsgD family transcriptional regulator
MTTDAQVKPSVGHLTPRQLEVLELICQGYSTRQVADLLGVSYKTASCHRTCLLEKARVHNSVRLFRWALQQGHVTLGDALPPAGPSK